MPSRRLLVPALLLPLLALGLGVLRNTLAGPSTRLAWGGRPLESPVLPLPPLSLPSSPSPTPPAPAPPRSEAGIARPLPGDPAPARAEAAGPGSVAQGPVREIDGAEAWALFQQKALFLDARRSAEFEAGHVAGAWSLPVWEADLDTKLTLFEAGSGAQGPTPLVVYCDGGGCTDSHLLAAKLLKLGFRRIQIHREGFPEWVAQGRPVTKGAGR